MNLSAGERATFKCGFRGESKLRSQLILATNFGGILLSAVGFPLTGWAAFGLGFVALLFAGWRDSITPGSYLSLRPQAELPLLELPGPHIIQRPRMTIRAWMFLVAVIAFLLGIGIEECLMQRRARQEALDRDPAGSVPVLREDTRRHRELLEKERSTTGRLGSSASRTHRNSFKHEPVRARTGSGEYGT